MFISLKLVYDIEDSYNDYWNYFVAVAEPSNCATMVAFKWKINFIEDYYSGRKTSLVLLEEDYKKFYRGVVFKKFSPFLETYNEMPAWMQAFGFMEVWKRNFVYDFVKYKIEEIGPQVLTMDHLRIGFIACLVPLVVSAIVFFAEILKARLSRERENKSSSNLRIIHEDRKLKSPRIPL